MVENIIIRREKAKDVDDIRAINKAAFATDTESRLVDQLREEVPKYLSLVAVVDGNIAGHILFTPVSISENPDGLHWVGLAPMAVVPERQRTGIGTKLVEEGLTVARDEGYHGVVVLGHPEYYTRFGFDPAHFFGLKSTYDVHDEAFMVKELKAGSLERCCGVVQYHPLFDEL